MTRRFALSIAALLLPAVLAGAARAAESVPGPAPQELIETTARKLLEALDADREQAKKDPTRVRKLVDEILLPHFDTDYSARLVLGKHWRAATPEQRRRFIDAFYQSLLRNYGSALADFTADRLAVLPFRGDLASGQATVRTEVKRSNGARVPVNYSLHSTPQGWKAWDVTIEGISYVRNFRNDVGAEVDQAGLESVIKRLETEGPRGANGERELSPADWRPRARAGSSCRARSASTTPRVSWPRATRHSRACSRSRWTSRASRAPTAPGSRS